tara:strand:+ start:320 stop:952 length:633 start_codon:yes stop_codon:yes gene_type:complete
MGFSLGHILYFHMPRTAGDSIRKSIDNFPQLCRITTHHNQKWATDQIKQHKNNSHKNSFTFVRNPYNRLYSAYNWIMNRDTSRNDELGGVDLEEKQFLSKFDDVNDFAKNVKDVDLNQSFMIHFHPLSNWIWDDEILVTNVFKFEDLFIDDTDFKDWCKKNDLIYNGLIDETHKSNWTEKNYFDYWDKDSIFNINKLYEKDFEIFGYELR